MEKVECICSGNDGLPGPVRHLTSKRCGTTEMGILTACSACSCTSCHVRIGSRQAAFAFPSDNSVSLLYSPLPHYTFPNITELTTYTLPAFFRCLLTNEQEGASLVRFSSSNVKAAQQYGGGLPSNSSGVGHFCLVPSSTVVKARNTVCLQLSITTS
jgi:hypothetical protein